MIDGWDILAAAGFLILVIGLWLLAPWVSLSMAGAMLLGAGVWGAR